MMHSSAVERKIRVYDNIKICAVVTYVLQWKRNRWCVVVYKVKRKMKTTGVHGNINFKCSCHLQATRKQRQTMCGSQVERKIKTTGVHGNIKINVQLSTYRLQWKREMMHGCEVKKKIKTAGVHGNIWVQLSLTGYNGAEIMMVVVKWKRNNRSTPTLWL